MNYVSLFTGIGGFDLGFDRANMQCVAQVENDKNCRMVLAHHWPDVDRRIEDVKDFRRETFSGTVDLLCGGFPCQDVSVAGRREGLDGKRSGLWFEFLRIIAELKPKWVVVENVPGLLSSNEKRDFATILSGLGECGYGWAYRICDAQYWGIPQRRRRVFIVGCLGDWRSAAEVLFERESSPWDTAPSREAGKELARDVAASIRSRGDGTGTRIDNETGLVAGSQTATPIREVARSDEGLRGNAGGVGTPERSRNDVPRTRIDNETGLTVARPLAFGSTLNHYDESQQSYIPTIPVYKKRGGFGVSETNDVSPTLESEGGTHQGGPERVPMVLAFPGMAQSGAGWAPPSMPVDEDRSGPLDTKRAHCVAYTVHSEHSTAMTGDGDAKVAFETETARSLDSSGGYATNQGGNVVAFDRTTAGVSGEVSAPLRVCGAKSEGVNDAKADTQCVAIQHSIIGRKPEAGAQGKGWRDDGTTWTLDGRGEADVVAYGFSQESDGSTVRNAKDLARPITGRHGDPGVVAFLHCNKGRPDGRQSKHTPMVTAKEIPTTLNTDGHAQSAIAGGFGVRRLTPLECSRLQGFSDDWLDIDGMSDSAKYRMLGNAVAVPVATWLGRRIMQVERG